METLKERDLIGPHRGIQIKLTELHGVMGGAQWKIEREPFWMEISPLLIAQIRAANEALDKRRACPHRACPTPDECRTECQCAMQKSQ